MAKQKTPLKHARTHKSVLTFSDHIRELRRRALMVALVFMAASGIAYHYHDTLVKIVMAPLDGEKLIYLTPGGGFSFIFQITLYAGLIMAGPMLMYQLYAFLRPTLPPTTKSSAFKVASFATLLMVGGVTYGYFVAVPAALTFLSTFAGTEILPSLTADSYLNFFLAYVGGLALLFQLPLLLIFWHWIHPLKPSGLLKSERYMIIFAFIAAAIITPTPDIVNQAMIAVPLIAIYQIGIIVVLITTMRAKRQDKLQPHAADAPKPQKQPSAVPQHIPPLKIAPSPAMSPRSSVQSLDGFSKPAVRAAPLQRAPRQLNIPSRPAPRDTIIHRRPVFRIDGMSPL